VAARIRRDWESGDTIEIDGCVLARTEARLCALVAFDSEGGGDGG